MCDVFFFFQAEDGIRDLTVTGVQTCALPISSCCSAPTPPSRPRQADRCRRCREDLPSSHRATADGRSERRDRKSTRLNSSHSQISYAVFCLKKKNTTPNLLSGVNISTLACTS